MSENLEIDVIDIKIFPNRILSAKTTEKVLNDVYTIDGLLRVIIDGKSLPEVVYEGAAKGLPVNHDDRVNITVNKNEIELGIKVGEIILTVDKSKVNSITEYLEECLDDHFPFGYHLSVGTFSKRETTISDYLKYGPNFEDKIDKRLIGMTDARSKSTDTVKIIK